MDYRNIGRSDLKVSVVGFGAWQAGHSGWGDDYGDSDVLEAMKYALANGVNYIDTAMVYGDGHSEEIVGSAISGFNRDDIVIATKVNPPHLSHDAILKSCENSIKRMKCKYIDLYQLHWPDRSVPIEESISAMEKLVDSGKVRYIGLCNYYGSAFEEALEAAKKHEIISNQLRYNLLQREIERDPYPAMKKHGVEMIAWSPIAKGLLSGKYNPENLPHDRIRAGDRLFSPGNIEKLMPVLDMVRKIASDRGKSMVQVSLNYLLCKDSIVIPGIKRRDQIIDCMGASGWKLSDKEIADLDRASSEVRISE